MISVIIPTLNEAETIASVVEFALSCPYVSEVLVVDDLSVDETVKRATDAGAKVITSTKLGKGTSMKDGLTIAANEYIVFLDGDINPYPQYTINKLVEPLLHFEYDFVKGTFARQAGRVTELVAKPLLSILFPKLSKFNQPLSGMIAGRKAFFSAIEFEEGYGVDIGLLIDMHLLNAKICEVNIGSIENKMKPWQELSKMAKEVSSTIIKKANHRKGRRFNLSDIRSFGDIRHQMEYALKEELGHLKKMVVFDMDNTLLQGRFIDECATEFKFTDTLQHLRETNHDPIALSKKVAQLLKGIPQKDLIKIADSISPVDDAKEVIATLKNRGYIVGIISDSYYIITNFIKNKVGADFSLANELEFSKLVTTGEMRMPSFFFHHHDSICRHTACKTNALQHIAKQYAINLKNIITIGDSLNDLCMVQQAGVGVAFCSEEPLLNYCAYKVIKEKSFKEILEIAL